MRYVRMYVQIYWVWISTLPHLANRALAAWDEKQVDQVHMCYTVKPVQDSRLVMTGPHREVVARIVEVDRNIWEMSVLPGARESGRGGWLTQ